jgi:hypothetical protein
MTYKAMVRLLADGFTEKFCEMFLKVRTKKAEIVPFKFWSVQKKLYKIYKETELLKKPLRFIVLKARQEGVSTFWDAVIFVRTITNFDRKNLIVGHEIKSANNLFDMCKRYYDNLLPTMKPVIERSNEKKISFAKLRSEINVASAEVGGALQRSDTIYDAHLTEVAWWRDAKSALLAIMQTIGDDPEKLVVLESTANGVGGEFHSIWVDAVNGENDFIPIFIAWFELDEYSKKFDNGDMRERFALSLTEEEKALQTTFSLTLEQLNWRRWAIENLCGGDVDMFHQEYCSTADEAFLLSGRPVFDPDTVNKHLKELQNFRDYRQGYLEYKDDKKNSVRFVDRKNGYIKLFDQELLIDPLDNFRFVAGSDVAEGLEQGDRSINKVFDRKTKKVCLTWAGQIHPDLLGEEQHKISLFLGGDVWFCTERNNHGLTTLVESFRLGVKNYYQQDFQAGFSITTDKIGYKTSVATKPQYINILNRAIEDKLFEDNEIEFWRECSTFVKNEKGQMQAQGKDKDPGTKCFDDRVIAAGLMWLCNQWLPPMSTRKKEEIGWVKEWKKKVKGGVGFKVGQG